MWDEWNIISDQGAEARVPVPCKDFVWNRNQCCSPRRFYWKLFPSEISPSNISSPIAWGPTSPRQKVHVYRRNLINSHIIKKEGIEAFYKKNWAQLCTLYRCYT